MRSIVTQSVGAVECPSLELRNLAAQKGGDQAYNDEIQNNWPCLTTLELKQPDFVLPEPETLTIAAWNLERCKRVEESADLLRRAEVDIILATELDHGMARSGQRHTTRDLAQAMDMGYVFGTEFVELGVGDAYETSLFSGVSNANGLHGNAILSRFPLTQATILPLDDGGLWFVSQPKNDGQLRLGGRVAIAAQIATSTGMLTLAAVHYESESDPDMRALQTQTLLDRIHEVYGQGPSVIGGDLNTNKLCDGARTATQNLESPHDVEPAFAAFDRDGFGWRSANSGQVTTRAAPGRSVRDPLQILDWLLVRECVASNPKVWPAVSETGHYLSDHELITARICT